MGFPTIKQLREWAVDHALQRDLTTIGADRVDYAWRIVLEDLLHHVPAIGRTSTSVNTTADQATIDLSALPTSWARDRFVEAWVDTDYPLALRDEHDIRARRRDGTSTGRPCEFALLPASDDTAIVYPTPDAIYPVRIIFDEPLTIRDGDDAIAAWTDGADPSNAAAATTHYVNVDERWARMACFRGVPHVLTHGDPKAAFKDADWERFLGWAVRQFAKSRAVIVNDVIGHGSQDIATYE